MKKQVVKQQILTVVFLVTTGVVQLFSQSALSAYSGKEFLVAFGKNDTRTDVSTAGSTDTIQLILRITAIEQADVSIQFNANSSLNETVSLTAGEIRDYKLSYQQAVASYSGVSVFNNFKSISVSSTGDITIIAVNTAPASVEATLVMPVENLGTEYIYSSLAPAGTNQTHGFVLVATEDNTTITVSNTSLTPNPPVLKKGEIYSYSNNSNNMLGLTIKSSKPIAYFLNATKIRLNGPTGGYYRDNYSFEQIPPVNQWGTKFIIPTVFLESHAREAVFARIYSKESGNTIQIKYTNGTTTNYTYSTSGNHDIRIDNVNNSNAKAAYIESNSPVGIYLYHAPYDYNPNFSIGDPSQPGVAWLPPVEQTIASALISPLDLDAKHAYLQMYHDFIIITPTATKNNTMISVDGGQPQSLLSTGKFQWIADTIGGSNYSLGRYHFGWHDPRYNTYLNTTAFVENPDGIIVLAYGHGSYTNYFYTVGAAARSLDMAAYINGTYFDEANGQVFCLPDFELTAVSNLPHSQANDYPRWYFDSIEDTNLRGKGLVGHSSIEVISKSLTPGKHTVIMEYKDINNNVKSRKTTITVNNPLTVGALSLSEFCDKSSFDPNPPAVTGGSFLSDGWQLETSVGSNVYNKINVPYTVSLSDNGKRIRYYAENDCGVVHSNAQTLVVNPTVTPSVKMSVTVD